MGTYRHDHQSDRHHNKDFVTGVPQEGFAQSDIALAGGQLAKLRRQVEIRNREGVEAVVADIEDRCFALLRIKDDGTMPEIIASLKRELADAREQFMR